MLFGFVVLVGAFFIGSYVFQYQAPVIPNLDAQMVSGFGSSSPGYRDFGGIAPQDILFSRQPFSSLQSGAFYSSTRPGDVMFQPGMHPGSYIFNQALFPGDIIIDSSEDGSRGKTEMRTIMTCGGCALTMATCAWDCGQTFAYCNTGTLYGAGFTGLTCPGPTGLICDSGDNTNIVCTSGFCSSGGNTLMTCSGGIFCDWSGGNTSRTCDVFGCRSPGINVVYPDAGNTLITCSSGLYGLCGGQIEGIYGRSMSDFYIGAIPFEAGSPPAF